MQKILVLRGGALGDFIVTLPALALLRQRWPRAQIELAGNPAAATLALPSGLLDRIHSQHEARWAALFATTASPLPPDFARWLATFDLILNFWPDPEGDLRGRFPLHDGQTFLTAAALPTRAPAAAHYCEPLRALGLTPAQLWHRLARHAPDARLIAIHPGSGSSAKNWPLSRWETLCTELDADLLIITGEAEPADTLARFGLAARQLPLAELVARLAHCRLFVGHDSGIGHLAAACGVPSLLLFGPTDPAIWAPPAPHVRVLRRGLELASISVGDVQREIQAMLADQT